jgi:hypothetical protein
VSTARTSTIEKNARFAFPKAFYLSKLANTTLYFKRYLYSQFNWDSRVIGIKGEHGVGMTTHAFSTDLYTKSMKNVSGFVLDL